MSHITKEEYLSAFLDGEAGSFEEHRLSDQLDGDDLLRDKLRDYALIGEAMRHESQPLPTGNTFLSGIQDAIKDDAPLQASDSPFQQADPDHIPPVIQPDAIPAVANEPWRMSPQIVGYAAVASLAAVAALSLQNFMGGGSAAPSNTLAEAPAVVSEPAAEKQQPTAASAQTVATKTEKYSVPNAAMRNKMAQYAQHHLQYASSSTLMPWVRTVSYSTDY